MKVINDAAMQALGSYKKGKMLFPGIGNGTGVGDDRGWTPGADGAGAPAFKRATYEDYVGLRGLQRLGKKKWREKVDEVAETADCGA